MSAATMTISQVEEIERLIGDVNRRVHHLSAVEHNNPAAIALGARLTGIKIDAKEAIRYQDAAERARRLPSIIRQLQDLLALSAEQLAPVGTPATVRTGHRGRPRGSKTTKATAEAPPESSVEPVTLPTEWHGPEPEAPVEEPASEPSTPVTLPPVEMPTTRKPRKQRRARHVTSPSAPIPLHVPSCQHTIQIGCCALTLRLEGNWLNLTPDELRKVDQILAVANGEVIA